MYPFIFCTFLYILVVSERSNSDSWFLGKMRNIINVIGLARVLGFMLALSPLSKCWK